MKDYNEWLDASEPVERCTECPHPNGCIRECVMEKYVSENVAEIRGEGDLDVR